MSTRSVGTLLLPTPSGCPFSKRAQRTQQLLSYRCQLITLAFVTHKVRGAQFCKPRIQEGRIGLGGGLEQAESHGLAVPQFPKDP
jgi:glutaredoxin